MDKNFCSSKTIASELYPGDKVIYIPTGQKGMVKSVPHCGASHCFVVFNCGNDWQNYANYTGVNTPKDQLKKGWTDAKD